MVGGREVRAEADQGERMSEDKKSLFLYYWNALTNMRVSPVEEYNFDKEIGRKHRFDFAFPDFMVAVEINGNAWNVKGGGRHGNDADLEKINIAVSMGWKVFQLSPKMLQDDPERWLDMVCRAIR
jgi:very-short-patch-repair endonuclease